MINQEINILFIEDDPVLLNILTSMGKAKEIGNIDTAETKKEAEEKLRSKKYDVVVSDMMLPDGSGKEVVEGLNGKVPPLLLFFTGYSASSREELIKLGAKDVLAKPMDLKKIFDYINDFKKSLKAAV